mmetsp:Transcript_87451/g.187623  ORF Transcript_87451/g.187623 Transcript_87451/m.187623 type:complete len:355 (-) Transcript_87451:907-1971(-)
MPPRKTLPYHFVKASKSRSWRSWPQASSQYCRSRVCGTWSPMSFAMTRRNSFSSMMPVSSASKLSKIFLTFSTSVKTQPCSRANKRRKRSLGSGTSISKLKAWLSVQRRYSSKLTRPLPSLSTSLKLESRRCSGMGASSCKVQRFLIAAWNSPKFKVWLPSVSKALNSVNFSLTVDTARLCFLASVRHWSKSLVFDCFERSTANTATEDDEDEGCSSCSSGPLPMPPKETRELVASPRAGEVPPALERRRGSVCVSSLCEARWDTFGASAVLHRSKAVSRICWTEFLWFWMDPCRFNTKRDPLLPANESLVEALEDCIHPGVSPSLAGPTESSCDLHSPPEDSAPSPPPSCPAR